ncbi:MAG: hypothetical protein ACE5EZ_05985 [Thermodesulfobacteriota bacterium]
MKDRRDAVERVITRMCRDVERKTGRTPEGKDLRKIERRVVQGAVEADKRRAKQF